MHQDRTATRLFSYRETSQKAPSAKRCIKTSSTCSRLPVSSLSESTERQKVHQDPANMCRGQHKLINRQKAPSAKRCIKTIGLDADADIEERQKAPSAKRCIKTRADGGPDSRPNPLSESTERQKVHQDTVDTLLGRPALTGQKAPSAKRCIKTPWEAREYLTLEDVRKHRAPKGASRRARHSLTVLINPAGQKAPSAKRCIKTPGLQRRADRPDQRQKAPSPKRCILGSSGGCNGSW